MGCAFGPDAAVADTVDQLPDLSKLKHVIVMMRENRSFDHYLGAYDREQDPPLGERANPDPSRHKMQKRFHEAQYCTRNPDHEWNAVHLQYNNGRLDGFVVATNNSDANDQGCVAMGYYTREDIPFYYWLADHFAISERYHAALLGPTMPNIMFYYYASSCNSTENVEASGSHWIDSACRNRPTIFKLIEASGHSAQVYSDAQVDIPGLGLRAAPQAAAAVVLAGYPPSSARTIDRFRQDVLAGTLADVVFVEPNYKSIPLSVGGGTENDEHPPSNVQDGQAFLFERITEVMNQPAIWNSSVVFVTWDEHGGYYDHVVPPSACAPDENSPPSFDFKHLGFRTPFFAISPFAREHYVSRNTADHTSIARFIEAWLGLGALTKRDANAWPLFDMFDFEHPRAIDIPPTSLAEKSTDFEHVGMCNSGHETSTCVTP